MSNRLTVSYDRHSDVLYLSVGPSKIARSEEEQPGLVWRYDVSSGKVIGLTVVDFSTYWWPRATDLAHQIADRLYLSEKDARNMLREAHEGAATT